MAIEGQLLAIQADGREILNKREGTGQGLNGELELQSVFTSEDIESPEMDGIPNGQRSDGTGIGTVFGEPGKTKSPRPDRLFPLLLTQCATDITKHQKIIFK